MRLDGAHDALPSFVGVDVQRVQVFADIVQGLEFGVDGAADVGLDAEVLGELSVDEVSHRSVYRSVHRSWKSGAKELSCCLCWWCRLWQTSAYVGKVEVL